MTSGSLNHDGRRTTARLNERTEKADNLEREKVATETPLFTAGVIADIQYAPIPDGHSFSGQPRYYRHALETARVAAQHFESEKVDCVFNLGDTVDGKCFTEAGHVYNNDEDEKEHPVDHVIEALGYYTHGPILHTYGNHELYNLPRHALESKLKIPFKREPPHDELVGYYSFALDQTASKMNDKMVVNDNNGDMKVRFVVLDSYDISLMGRCSQTSTKHQKAHAILAEHNPNYPENENSPVGLEGLKKRFVAFNGAVDKTQLAWLRKELANAEKQNEKVIVLSHQPILPGSSSPVCLMWNYEEVLDILHAFSHVVLASFSGHAHKGGYLRDETSGIHFRVLEAVLESPSPIKTYGFIDFYNTHMEVRGNGDLTSATYDFDHTLSSKSSPWSCRL
jgi:manganese-dependent ADP-ribose/CDP-alcohol diphosphatase